MHPSSKKLNETHFCTKIMIYWSITYYEVDIGGTNLKYIILIIVVSVGPRYINIDDVSDGKSICDDFFIVR